MAKQEAWSTPSDVLSRRLREMAGVHALEAISGFAGPRPALGWRRLFVLDPIAFAIPTRILAHTQDGLELWSANTGAIPNAKLSTHSLSHFRVLDLDLDVKISKPQSFDEIAIEGEQLWVSSTYRDIINQWTHLKT
ncbi:hypothetical protein M6D93_04105 [Jatrophihabitans telluris]|uniref:Uncharacterized protein n=1 Tax=Jatrophihabitans telluris TaxID=2038343 RepID=A0ABY4R0Z7_9ACTN|nr:hypothetical protein [Jatrophihabitans telluris]UQX89192.1 hypothetical protein M6D93_04105 [Jatrophihabitans telluris]